MNKTDQGLPRISDKAALELVTSLMAIPGKSGSERAVVEEIERRLKQAGVPSAVVEIDRVHRKSPVGGDVGNVIVRLAGTRRGPRRLLMAHIDTVPLCVGSKPIRRGDVIESQNPQTALGADDRAGASVVLNAAIEIYRQGLEHPPLTLFWPVQEEIGLYGSRHVSLSRLGRPRLCFNWDGGLSHTATIGATGDYNIEIEIEGIASHAGGHPEQGVSAIAIAGLAIADLVENGWHGLVIKGRNVGTSNIGVVNGGHATNVVTPKVVLQAEVRSHDPAFRRKLRDEFRRAFERAAKKAANDSGQRGCVHFEADLKYESFRLSEDEPCVLAATAAIEAVGLEPELRITNGGLDANWMSARGLPTVTLGCGQRHPHTVNEQLHIESYLQACRVGLLLATGN